MVVSMGIPRPVDLKWTGGFATVGVAQVRENAAVLALELLDRIERAGEQTGHARVQRSTGDEQQRKAGTGLTIADAHGTSFVELGSSALSCLLSKHLRPCRHWCDRIHVGVSLALTFSDSCKRNHPGPPLGERSDVDVVFANERELAVLTHPEHGQAG